MPNKKDEQSKDLITPDPDLEEKVTKMLDPTLPDEPPKLKIISEPDPTTAPEVDPSTLPTEIKFTDDAPQVSTEQSKTQTAPEVNQPESATEPAEASESAVENEVPDKEPLAASETPEAPDDLPPIKDDAATVKAVEDIVASDSDALLAAEDEKIAAAFEPQAPKPTGNRLANFFKKWWNNPKSRYASLAVVFCLVLAAGIVPQSRYFILNSLGIRASASVRVIDESTLQPLKNVTISIGELSAKTDNNGNASLTNIKLGPAELSIEKRAFASESKQLTIGWGSNPLGDTKLKPTGTQYAFVLTDYLSGQPVEKAEAESGEHSAFSDGEGKLLLTMDEPSDEFEVVIASEGHRIEKLTISADSKSTESVQLVASRPHVFVSKRTGQFDIYKIDVDGKNEAMILEGTGHERADMALVPHDHRNLVALVSTRGGTRNADGFLLSTLTIIDIEDGSTKEVSTSEKIHVIGWRGDVMVYVKIAEGASAVSPDRHRLMSYNVSSGSNIEIASSNYFNDVIMIDGYVYYAPSGLHSDGVNVSLFKVNADGTNNDVVIDSEVWNMFRTSYGSLSISMPGEWREYNLNDGKQTNLSGEPANLANRVYVDGPDLEKSLWVENRDGKGVLLAYDKNSKEDKVLYTRSGLANPIFWLNKNTAVFRITTDEETADYAISLDGGEAKKIVDVTNTSGVDNWYYY